MAKKPAQQVIISIDGDSKHSFNALYKHIELKPGALQFLHLERKGNTWLLLDAMVDRADDWHDFLIEYIKPTENLAGRRFLRFKGKDVDVLAYTVIHLPNQAFYHLDELPDGSWRITHSDGLIHCDHNSLHHYSVRKV
jgi:hypothetical protein